MKVKVLNDILDRQYRYYDRMKMTLEERSAAFTKKVISELEKAGLEIEREPDIDVLDLPRVMSATLDDLEDDELSYDEEKLIEKFRALLDRVRS